MSFWNSLTSVFKKSPEELEKEKAIKRQQKKREINQRRQQKIKKPIFYYKNLEVDNYNRIQYPIHLKDDSKMDEKMKSQRSVEFYKEELLKKLENPIHVDVIVKTPKGDTTQRVTLEYYIPKGTILYHASNDENIEFTEDRQTYFGFDIIISLWFLVELLTDDSSYGIIHQYEVVKDIPVYLLEDITEHPKGSYICKRKDIACIHPQYAYHGHTLNHFKELSSELTMNLTYPFFKDSIKPSIHPTLNVPIKYLVDVDQLRYYRESGNFTVHRFNPIQPNKGKNRDVMNELIEKGYGSFYSAILGFYLPYKNKNNQKSQAGGNKTKKNTHRKKGKKITYKRED